MRMASDASAWDVIAEIYRKLPNKETRDEWHRRTLGKEDDFAAVKAEAKEMGFSLLPSGARATGESTIASAWKGKRNPRSAPDKYGDRTGYHMTLSYGVLPKKAEFERIWEDEMGSSSYRWDLKNRDGDVVSAVKDEFQDKHPALKGVTDSGIRDADAAWVLLHALKKYHEEPGEPEDSEDMSAEEIEEWQNEWAEEAGNLASALLETLGIEWV